MIEGNAMQISSVRMGYWTCIVLTTMVVLIQLLGPHPSFAHSGGLDKNGCHAGSKPYHCHRSQPKPKVSREQNKKTTKPKSKTISGIITHVRDGDTFVLGNIPIRLAAVDCPEKNTRKGKIAKRFMEQFKGNKATCQLTGAKTYDRLVGYCYLQGADIGRVLFANTSCRPWHKYDVWNRY